MGATKKGSGKGITKVSIKKQLPMYFSSCFLNLRIILS